MPAPMDHLLEPYVPPPEWRDASADRPLPVTKDGPPTARGPRRPTAIEGIVGVGCGAALASLTSSWVATATLVGVGALYIGGAVWALQFRVPQRSRSRAVTAALSIAGVFIFVIGLLCIACGVIAALAHVLK